MKKGLKVWLMIVCLSLACLSVTAYASSGAAYSDDEFMYTDDELCEMAKQYYADRNDDYVPTYASVDRDTSKPIAPNEVVEVRLFEYGGNMRFTSATYNINRSTGKGTEWDWLTNKEIPVDLTPYATRVPTGTVLPYSFDAATGSITGCNKSITEAIIPSEINGIPVISIGYAAFKDCGNLRNVTIPEGVTSIGGNAFQNCSNLTSITIPDSVTYIAGGAFERCSNLTSITIPNSVTYIGISAFEECSSLTSVIIPNGITQINEWLFQNCTSLSSVRIPASVTLINDDAFYCRNLANVYYEGSEAQWKQILVMHIRDETGGWYQPTIEDYGSDTLFNGASPTIHYNSTGPSVPSMPGIPTKTTNAVLSPQKLTVNGANVECEKYNIGGSNYFKLRDLAYVLNGTVSQFEVGFDAATSTVTITTGAAYTANGSELAAGVDNASTAQTSRQTILIDGVERSDLTAYNIGGSNFFQLRELGTALGFEVDFDAASNTAIVRSAMG